MTGLASSLTLGRLAMDTQMDRAMERRIYKPSVRDQEIAGAIGFARRQRPPMKRFAYELRISLSWTSLSRQMVYKWEKQESRVPASVLLAGADVVGLLVEDLLVRSQRFQSFRTHEGSD